MRWTRREVATCLCQNASRTGDGVLKAVAEPDNVDHRALLDRCRVDEAGSVHVRCIRSPIY
jgi:hypothetical protein